MLTNNNGRFFWSANLEGAIENICNHSVPVSLCNNKYFHSRSMSGALAGVSLLGVLGGLLPQYDLRAWETARLEVKIFWRRFTNCDRRLKIQVHTVTNTIAHYYKSYYVLTQIKVYTAMSKYLNNVLAQEDHFCKRSRNQYQLDHFQNAPRCPKMKFCNIQHSTVYQILKNPRIHLLDLLAQY